MPPSPPFEPDGGLLLEQQIRYSYDRPIRHLRHRLVVVPRELHGEQVRTGFGITVSDERAGVNVIEDAFSNCVARINVAAVVRQIEFTIWAIVTWRSTAVSSGPRSSAEVARFVHPTPLTQADREIAALGRELAATHAGVAAVGEMACHWASQAITYGFGVTDVHTSAASALAEGTGVCQDYAHLMLAVCRAAGVPARYVSGHLTGEGGSHAWVEVLEVQRPGDGAVAIGFDPTHDRPVDDRYLTVAVGRDYADVAPTSGTFRGRARSELVITKVVRPAARAEHPNLNSPTEASAAVS